MCAGVHVDPIVVVLVSACIPLQGSSTLSLTCFRQNLQCLRVMLNFGLESLLPLERCLHSLQTLRASREKGGCFLENSCGQPSNEVFRCYLLVRVLILDCVVLLYNPGGGLETRFSGLPLFEAFSASVLIVFFHLYHA